MRTFLAAGASILAMVPCDVPVFRYALEHWPAEPYVLVLRSGGAPGPAEAAVLEALERKVREGGGNLEVRRAEGGGPRVVLRYPDSAGIARTVWEGRLADLPVEGLLDSPARRLAVRKIQEGAAAVWIFLESGDRAADDAAAGFLEACLREGERAGHRTPGPDGAPEVRPVFPLIRLSRADPAEEMLVRMLLRSEEGLEAAAGPMAFPVFGRGRKLEALVGKGISAENVAEYVAFLTGPCSCQVKLQNPGVDLLLTADWEGRLGESPIGDPFLETASTPASGGPGLWGWVVLAVGAAGVAASGGLFLIRGRRLS